MAGVRFVQRPASASRPKIKNRITVDRDLIELSSSSRSSKPSTGQQATSVSVAVHGKRTDVVSSPERGAEVLLAKIAGSPSKVKTPSSHSARKALMAVNANTPGGQEW